MTGNLFVNVNNDRRYQWRNSRVYAWIEVQCKWVVCSGIRPADLSGYPFIGVKHA